MKTAIIYEKTTALVMRPSLLLLPYFSFPTNQIHLFLKGPNPATRREKNCGTRMRSIAQLTHPIRSLNIILSTSAAAARKSIDVYFQLLREIVEVRRAARFMVVQDENATLLGAIRTGLAVRVVRGEDAEYVFYCLFSLLTSTE
jgi:hypothetical protein